MHPAARLGLARVVNTYTRSLSHSLLTVVRHAVLWDVSSPWILQLSFLLINPSASSLSAIVALSEP